MARYHLSARLARAVTFKPGPSTKGWLEAAQRSRGAEAAQRSRGADGDARCRRDAAWRPGPPPRDDGSQTVRAARQARPACLKTAQFLCNLPRLYGRSTAIAGRAN